MHEFEIIKHFFAERVISSRRDVVIGIGDDCALVEVPVDQALAISTDTLVVGVHFFENADPADIGYKALAVNLSDLAAMGAEPAWVSVALTLPQPDEKWLQGFSEGFFTLLDHFSLQLIGGDLTQGPLTITMHVQGFVPKQQVLRRGGAKSGDRIYVSNSLGDAGLALRLLRGEIVVADTDKTYLLNRLNRPEPRISEGLALRNIASSAIDISDGLIADLGHILQQSGVGATINTDNIPLSPELSTNLLKEEALELALTAGDDYELCFTVPPKYEFMLSQSLRKFYCIGIIDAQPGLRLLDNQGKTVAMNSRGFEHFT